jgi:hypothetical protein
MSKLIENAMSFAKNLGKSVCERSKSWDESYIIENLDARDTDPFDSEWVSSDKIIQNSLNIEKNLSEEINEYRKNIFSIIIKKTGSSDLAGYISDDFELIMNGLVSCYSNKFFFSIINSYMKGEIPSNSMEMIVFNPTKLY